MMLLLFAKYDYFLYIQTNHPLIDLSPTTTTNTKVLIFTETTSLNIKDNYNIDIIQLCLIKSECSFDLTYLNFNMKELLSNITEIEKNYNIYNPKASSFFL